MKTDEPFCIEDQFYSDLESYISEASESGIFGDATEWAESLPDDWSQQVDLCSLDVMFKVDADDVDCWADTMMDRNEERMPEMDYSEEIKSAFLAGIDFEKINAAMPCLWYPNGNVAFITKEMILSELSKTESK